MKPIACNDWVMIEQEIYEKTEGGIIIPEKHQQKNSPARGKVYLVGERCTQVKEGDTVMFRKADAYKETIGDKAYAIVKEEDIFVIVDRPEMWD